MANFVDFEDQNGIKWAVSDKALIRFNFCKAIDPYPHDTWVVNYQNFEYKWSEKFSFKTMEEAKSVYDLLREKVGSDKDKLDRIRKVVNSFKQYSPGVYENILYLFDEIRAILDEGEIVMPKYTVYFRDNRPPGEITINDVPSEATLQKMC